MPLYSSGAQSEKSVIITGANGLLGQKVVEEFAPHFQVVATGLEAEPAQQWEGTEYQRMDITDTDSLSDLVSAVRPAVVINCAAYTDVDGAESEKETAWAVNAAAVKKMVRVLRRKEIKFVQISTDYVFDGTDGPYSEKDRPSPVNYYGTTKLAGDNAVIASGIDHLIFRTNVLYGVIPGGNNFVLWIIKSLRDGKAIRVVDDQVNNPTLADGLAHAILMGCVMNARGIFHYGGSELMDRYTFALRIAEHFQLDSSLISPCKTGDLEQLVADRPRKSGLKTEKVVHDLHITLYDTNSGLTQVEKDLKQCEI